MKRSLPIDKTDVRRYMTQTQSLDFTPGTQSKYSNYGFSLLGQVLERLNPGQSYPQIIDREVAWLIEGLQLDERTALLDMGCGPGLYGLAGIVSSGST